MKAKSKRGAEMNIAIIIVLILAVIALLILVISFTGGWTRLWRKITGTEEATGGMSLQLAIETCKTYATLNSKNAYCEKRNIETIKGQVENLNCEDLRNKYPDEFKGVQEITC
jgi:flagellar basal body-associated protein FliL